MRKNAIKNLFTILKIVIDHIVKPILSVTIKSKTNKKKKEKEKDERFIEIRISKNKEKQSADVKAMRSTREHG